MIALSVAWPIIAGIIEKRKKSQQNALKRGPSDQSSLLVESEWKADPVEVKIESLRRRSKRQGAAPTTRKSTPKKRIRSHHKEDCLLPPAISGPSKAVLPAKQLAHMLQNRRNLRTAIVLSELLGKPMAHRKNSSV